MFRTRQNKRRNTNLDKPIDILKKYKQQKEEKIAQKNIKKAEIDSEKERNREK